MLKEYLEEIGLTDKEAAIYLALLEFDAVAPSELAKKTGIKRTTVYVVLESLQKKGLASEVPSGKTSRYHAEPPERLQTYIERQKVLLDEKSARLKDIIPQIKSVSRRTGEHPIVKFFEGRDGAISAYEEFYEMHDNNSKEGFFIYNRDLLNSTFTEKEQDTFRKIRMGKNVTPISVYNKKGGDIQFLSPGTRTRIEEDKYPIYSDITIIDDRIIASTLAGEVTSIVIKSNDLAKTIASLIRYINDVNKAGGE